MGFPVNALMIVVEISLMNVLFLLGVEREFSSKSFMLEFDQGEF